MTANEVRQRIEAAREAIQEYLGSEAKLQVYLHDSAMRRRSASEADTMAMGASAVVKCDPQNNTAAGFGYYDVSNDGVMFTIFYSLFEDDEAAENEQAPAATGACAVGTA